MRSRWALLGALLLGSEGCAVASVGANRFLASGGEDLWAYQVAREAALAGPFGSETLAVFRPGGTGQTGWMAGAGIDLTVLGGQADHPYLIGGVQGGIGTRDQPGTWSSWSIGLGAQLLGAGPLGVRAEARYREMTAQSREGLEIGIRIGRGWSRSAPSSVAPAPVGGGSRPTLSIPGGSERLVAGTPDATRAGVIGLAIEAMGTPYRWGGSSADGFDCSGLIQFAYGEFGVTLPRRSVDQARAGEGVRRELAALLPGDILTFATGSGGVVSHVGLYLGDGRFIHSATGGVQISMLSAEDPYGRWWWQRWLGARRVVA